MPTSEPGLLHVVEVFRPESFRDHDGRIDAQEWEAACAAARAEVQRTTRTSVADRVSVVGKTSHGEPFLIAPFSEEQLARREKRYAAVWLGASAVFVALTLWTVQKALVWDALL